MDCYIRYDIQTQALLCAFRYPENQRSDFIDELLSIHSFATVDLLAVSISNRPRGNHKNSEHIWFQRSINRM